MICLPGFAELLRTEPLVRASLGDDINLKCELTEQHNVIKVTWLRVLEQMSEVIAAYSEHYGAIVAGSFQKNVFFVEKGLQQCSIVIKGVGWSDALCYECLFSVLPDGAISGRTCLRIYELHSPIFEVNPVDVSGERRLSLSCSVTGRPAPEVSWDIEDAALENSTTSNTTNPNGTITVTKTATAPITSRLFAKGTQIKCAAEQEFGERKEIFITVPNDDIPSDARHRAFSYIAVVVGGLCICICVLVGLKRCRHRGKDNSSQCSTTQSSATDISSNLNRNQDSHQRN